jgi:DNA invertase Pin-like site-specific DNA recombinase
MRAALYLRVSTSNGQTTDNQRLELEAVAGRSGWQVVEIYEDAGVSGAKAGRNDQRLIACSRPLCAVSST